jgi:NhaP-type Na+/H+ or K+/H+ antiporter
MLWSLAWMLLLGLLLGELFKALHLPSFLGMILTGILLGPHVLDQMDASLLAISSDLRTIALSVILIRAGLALDQRDLKIVGRPAIWMSFVPAIFEILALSVLANWLFALPWLEAFLLASVLAAVSPAVVVPRMLDLIHQGRGTTRRVPHLILGAASVDDIVVIVLFSLLLGMATNQSFDWWTLLTVPVALMTGVLAGWLIGWASAEVVARWHVRDTTKVLGLLAIALFLIALEDTITSWIPFSPLLAILVMGIAFLHYAPIRAVRVRDKFERVWVLAEVLLFVLVGSAVDVSVALEAGGLAVVLIAGGLIARIIGVQTALSRSALNRNERWFSSVAYVPKATVQAAIGGIPLMMGVASGTLILAIAVWSILLTAPLGATGIDVLSKRWLTLDETGISAE